MAHAESGELVGIVLVRLNSHTDFLARHGKTSLKEPRNLLIGDFTVQSTESQIVRGGAGSLCKSSEGSLFSIRLMVG
jgi:hypothetical protein